MEEMTATHSQAHLQFAQASTQPKIAKELFCLPILFADPKIKIRPVLRLKI